MTGFLTVEDVNGTVYSNQGFYWHEIDTSKISSDSDFTNVKYDFCKVSRETVTDEHSAVWGNYLYTLEIDNSLWTKGFYISPYHYNWATRAFNVQLNDNTLSFRTDNEYIGIHLYMGILKYNDVVTFTYLAKTNVLNLNYAESNTTTTVKVQEPGSSFQYNCNSFTPTEGYHDIVFQATLTNTVHCGYVLVNIVKSDFQFNCTQSLVVGKINKVYLGTDSKYKPSGSMVGSYATNITVDYNGETLPVQYDGTDYYFNLDLTDKTDVGKVRFKVNVEANEVLNKSSTDVVLESQYQTVNTFNALLSAVSISEIIQLGANMTATSNIPINRSIKIIGNDKSIDLDGYRFVLVEDAEFKAENLQLNNGDTTIIQAKNTKVELTGVTFNNCTSSNYNGLGSCIFCDVDIDSLDNTDDYITTLTECTFTDNANCILHGGDLTIQKCTLDNDTITNINPNNCAFVYQTDGTCLIQQSIFNINYDYTSAEANIGFAQALIMCGETANINGATHTDLQGDNTLPFFDAPFNNRADLTAKYYYPQITDNVESVGSVSGKACCHACSGVDWVFKNNVTVRRSE